MNELDRLHAEYGKLMMQKKFMDSQIMQIEQELLKEAQRQQQNTKMPAPKEDLEIE